MTRNFPQFSNQINKTHIKICTEIKKPRISYSEKITMK